jgi:iron complex transport system ATP-binding protein
MLEKLRISHLADKLYCELSGGEQQITLIARALAQEAQFIIMDEPASNLDFENQKKVLDVLKDLSGNGMGIVMSSHSPDHAFYCGTKTLMITKEKRIIFCGLIFSFFYGIKKE